MCPQVVERKVTIWSCGLCGTTDEREGGGVESPLFRDRARITVETAGRDYQGGVVGPGRGVAGDLCDDCMSRFWRWWQDNADHADAQRVVEIMAEREATSETCPGGC